MRQSLYSRLWDLQILQKLNKENFKFLYTCHPVLKRSRSDELYSYCSTYYYKELCLEGKSPQSIYGKESVSVLQPSGKVSHNYICVPYEEAPKRYIKFLDHICKFYRKLSVQNITRLEALCKEFLKFNQPSDGPTQYSIHKNFFEKKILHDRIIRVNLRIYI